MRHIKIPENHKNDPRRLPFYLSIEEWVAKHMPAGDYFFSWRVNPTVICGRNQEIDKEVNLDYCRQHGVAVVRRKSGGGCVYADMQNFMFSFITDSDKVTEVFARYTSMIAEQLQKLGFDAIASGRNDILIGEKKVSGNAFYHMPGRSIAHGTMLYDFDPVCLLNAITPSKAKLESKGVKSVPMRVTCLKNEGIALTPEEFEKFMIQGITDDNPYTLTEEDLHEIEEIEKGYYDPSYLRIVSQKGSALKDSSKLVTRREVIKGLGEFCIEYSLDRSGNEIHNFNISGDFFMNADVETLLCRPFEGKRCDKESLLQVLDEINPETIIPGLTSDILLRLICG